MKTDLQQVGRYLLAMDSCKQDYINSLELMTVLGLDKNKQEDLSYFWFYINYLDSKRYIECIDDYDSNLGFGFTSTGAVFIRIHTFRITMSGKYFYKSLARKSPIKENSIGELI